jgi:hypothetical protein
LAVILDHDQQARLVAKQIITDMVC